MEMIGGMGVEGFLFFWLFWIYWIFASFFMSKKSERLRLSIWLLLTIVFSVHTITIFDIHISYSGLFILVTSYLLIGREKGYKGIYLFIATFIMMLAYTTFHLFELYDPVWLIFNRQLILSVILAYLAILLHVDLKSRLLTTLSGAVHGELLYALILERFTDAHTVASLAFLDVIATSIVVLLSISGMKKVSAYFEKHIKHMEREKQKQS